MSPIAPIPDAPEPARVSRHAGIGEASKNVLVRFFVDVFNRIRYALSEMLRHAVESALNALETPATAALRPLVERAFDNPELPQEVRDLGARILSNSDPWEIAALIPIAIGLVVGIVSGAFRPFANVAMYFTDRKIKSARLDPGTGMAAQRLDVNRAPLVLDDLHDQGWSDERIAAIDEVTKQRLDVGDLLRLHWRGKLSEIEFYKRAARVGFDIREGRELMDAMEPIPGPSDLVRFQLREAWRDDVAAAWGYDQGDITKFTEWMEKQGLSADWAKLYWRSHWVVPSMGQGIEMWFRGELWEDQLVDLLKINDIAPGWIPKLMAIARPVPGRIDRRYAYREGEIEWGDLYDLYSKDGYTEKWAEVLANTTAKMAVAEAKGLTRAAVQAAYRKRRISPDEAIEMLADIGIREEVAAFYLSQVDDDRADDLQERRIDVVGRQYRESDISEAAARDQLAALQVLSDEIDVYLEEWSIARGTKIKRPSRSNLSDFFREGVIEISQYRDQMDRLGYSDLYIDWYLASLAIERQQITEKEEREARIEQDRIVKDRRRTDYQVAKSKVDTDIAELQAAIASAQVAMVEAENERDRRLSRALPAARIAALEREYQPELFDAEAAISEARLSVTRLQTAVKEEREVISLIDRSLVENVDMLKYTAWKAERLTAQTEQARLGGLIASNRVAIAQLKEAIAVLEDADAVTRAKLDILALQTEMAQYAEQQAHWTTTIETLDELMAAALHPMRRAELLAEKAASRVRIAELEVEIAELREEVRNVQGELETLERELEIAITALPGRDEQIAIKAESQVRIAEIESNIAEYRENVAELRLAKSRLNVSYRSV